MTPEAPAVPRERWEWRARLRRSPTRYRVYRVVVAVLGVLLLLLAVLLGPFPGPGGIPLALAGLAVLASEFVWARRVLHRARRHLHDFTSWAGRQPTWLRITGSAALLVTALGVVWAFTVVVGVPTWLPGPVDTALLHLPGAQPWGDPLG